VHEAGKCLEDFLSVTCLTPAGRMIPSPPFAALIITMPKGDGRALHAVQSCSLTVPPCALPVLPHRGSPENRKVVSEVALAWPCRVR